MTTQDRQVTHAETPLNDDAVSEQSPAQVAALKDQKEPGTIRDFLDALQARDTEVGKEIKRRQEKIAALYAEIKVLRREHEQNTRFLNASRPRKPRKPKPTT